MSSKRPYEESEDEINGREKLAKIENEASEFDLRGIIFRLLCPSSRADSLFETDGSTILRICQETGVGIKVEDVVMDCDDKEPGSLGTLKAEKNDSSAKKALLLFFERMFECRTGTDEGNDGMDETGKFSLRLLIFSSQLGCLLGTDNCVIKQLSSETGAQIQILPRFRGSGSGSFVYPWFGSGSYYLEPPRFWFGSGSSYKSWFWFRLEPNRTGPRPSLPDPDGDGNPCSSGKNSFRSKTFTVRITYAAKIPLKSIALFL